MTIGKLDRIIEATYKIGLFDENKQPAPYKVNLTDIWNALSEDDIVDCFGLGIANRFKDSHAACTTKYMGFPEGVDTKYLTKEQWQDWMDTRREFVERKHEQMLNGELSVARSTDEISVECNAIARKECAALWKDDSVKETIRGHFEGISDKDALKAWRKAYARKEDVVERATKIVAERNEGNKKIKENIDLKALGL